MKHKEIHIYTFKYDSVILSNTECTELYDEVKRFKTAWPNAKVKLKYDDADIIQVSYECAKTALAAATFLQQVLSQYSWWREIK